MKAIKYIIVIALLAALMVGVFFGAKFIEKRMYPLEYEAYIDEYSNEFSVPKSLVCAVINCESSFNPKAVSNKNAYGLMQIIPETFEVTGRLLDETINRDMYLDPQTNIRCGVRYLAYLYKNLEDWELSVAAYNAGIGNVYKWLIDTEYSKDGISLDKIPFPETEKYVKKVFAAKEKYEKLYSL